MKSVTKTKVTVRQRILNLLRKVDKPLDAKTIAKRGKLNYNTVRKELGALYRIHNGAVVTHFHHRYWGEGHKITTYCINSAAKLA